MTKSFFVLLAMLLAVFTAAGQDTLSLKQCHRLSRANEPAGDTKAMQQKQTALEIKNLQTAYFPQLQLNAKASYQSDAIEVDIPFPEEIGGPKTMSSDPDQYKVTLDVQQVIWDGGATKARREVAQKAQSASLQDVDVTLYQLRSQVNRSYFMLLLFQRQEALFNETLEVLREKFRQTQSAVKNGVLLPGSEEVLRAEILKTEQELARIKAGRKSTLQILRDLTGKHIAEDVKLRIPAPEVQQDMQIQRPENTYFELQREKLKSLNKLEQTSRMPKIHAFGQLGYGKPGLNMLSNTFDPYWLAGVQISWTPFDWNRTSRNKQKHAIQREILQKQEASFNKKMRVQSRQLLADIEQYRQMLKKDKAIVKSRSKVTRIYNSRLGNGAITPAAYLEQLNKEKQARIQRELHKIQLIQAKINYLNVLGQTNSHDQKSQNQ